MVAYLDCATLASDQAHVAINELDELLTTGFRGREVLVVEALIRELDRIERRTDELQVDIRAQLFAMERELAPVDRSEERRVGKECRSRGRGERREKK